MPSSRLADWLTRQWRHIGLAAVLLWPLHLLMRGLVWARRLGFRQGWLKTQVLAVPVVVVGNRVVGGAGKTPTVLSLIEHLRHQGWTPGVLSRGYGRQGGNGQHDMPATLILDERHALTLSAREVGDEPWLIWRRTRAPMAVASQRAQAGRALLAEHPEIDILVCDDGLQHLALARQIEIVVFDERGAGNGLLLPAGPLREPVDTPPGPGCTQPPLVLYNAERPSTAWAGHTAHKQLLPPLPLSTWWAEGHAPAQASSPADRQRLLTAQASQCWALAGIAQPERFFQPLRSMGLNFTPCPLPDHDALDPLPWPQGLSHVIMTEKDAVKLSPERLARQRPGTQVWVAPLAFTPAPGFWQDLDARLAPLRPPSPQSNDNATPWTPD